MIKKLIFIIGLISMNQLSAWKNWAENQQCNAKVVAPKNIAELRKIVTKAKEEKSSIRAYGTGHSWSDLVCSSGYILNTDKLNKVVSVDMDKKQVTFEAGIKVHELNTKLAKLGLCLSNQPAISKQSLAGVVSTATHGSGKTGTVASFITQLELLTADGKLLTISESENADLFQAARTSLGSLGVITKLTVQCEPLFKVEWQAKISNWDDVMANYKKMLTQNDFMQFYWNVADDSVVITIHNRVPNTTKNLHTLRKKVDYSHKLLSGSVGVIYYEEEIAIAEDKFIEAAKALRELVKKEYESSDNFPGILFRFVSAEKHNILSPASNQNVVYFSSITGTKNYEEFYKKFYNTMLQFNGRPHWGKINFITQGDAKKLYGKNYDQFIEIRKKLDPSGLFSNAFTKRIFGW